MGARPGLGWATRFDLHLCLRHVALKHRSIHCLPRYFFLMPRDLSREEWEKKYCHAPAADEKKD